MKMKKFVHPLSVPGRLRISAMSAKSNRHHSKTRKTLQTETDMTFYFWFWEKICKGVRNPSFKSYQSKYIRQTW